MEREQLQRRLAAARGDCPAELVLKNARIVNVFSGEIQQGDVAVCDGVIVGVGSYTGQREVDLDGRYVCPGLIDGHIHIESSMLCPPAFARAVLPHGTTAVITDPHEIANVSGTQGLEFMLEAARDLPLSVFFMLPSCVPATPLDESGAVLDAETLAAYYDRPQVLGLAELMDFYGTARGEDAILDKVLGCRAAGGLLDGHAPFLSGKPLNAYLTVGVGSDHECSCVEEAMEKLRGGQYIMIREGTAAKNLDALLPLLKEPMCHRCMLVTDDRHPGDLLREGHIDLILRKAIRAGVDPLVAIRCATLVPAQYFGLMDRGAVAPGYAADLLVLSDLQQFTVEQVYHAGTLVAENGKALMELSAVPDAQRYPRVFDSFHCPELTPEDFALPETGTTQRVICLAAHELLTTEELVAFRHCPDCAPGVDPTRRIVKLAVVERHHGTGHIGLGFLGNYGLRCGAVASSVAHDSHNLIVAGTNDADMALAANTVRRNRGGIAFAVNGTVLGEVPLPVAGLMSNENAETVDARLQALKRTLKQYCIAGDIDELMTLAFVSLPVIPKLRLTTRGVFDVEQQRYLPAVF
ncbi:MAG: adenine deaminase [Faecalibacterium sp.]